MPSKHDASASKTGSSGPASNGKRNTEENPFADPKNIKLHKRLCYLLRYGAVKEGLTVSERGYVRLADVMTVPLLSAYSEETLINEIDTSVSERGHKRFEMRTVDSVLYVKSAFCQRFERYPYHEGTKVNRLLEMCLQKITSNITDYSLEGIDEFLIEDIIRRLKRSKRLTNPALSSVLVPDLERLDLSDAYITVGSLKLVMASCPNLRILNLKFCDYLINDELLRRLIKNLPHLIDLNVRQCTHLTGQSLRNVAKFLPGIQFLNVVKIENFKECDVVRFIESCLDLRQLEAHKCKLPLTDEFCIRLAELTTARPNLSISVK